MSGTNRKNKLSMLLVASLISANLVCASDAYKNNVVDVKVNKEAGNSVKVTIYTDKPYTEPVVVNKKANNKYVILMPETNSSLKSAPTVTNGAGTVSNVSVNTQAVSGGKGYTKIIITSEKAINVVPRTQQLTGVKVTEKPSTTVTKLNTNKPVTTTKAATQEKKPATAKTTAQKPKQEVKKTAAKPAVKPAAKPAQPVKVATQPVKPVETAKPVQPAVKQEPIDILEKEIKTGKNANFAKTEDDAILQKEIDENLSKNDKPKKKQVVYNDDKKSVLENIRAVLIDFQQIGLWKLLLLAGAITFPVIVIMLILAMDKKINKKIALSFKREEDEEQPAVAPQQAQPQPTTAQPETFNSFDEMLNKVDEPIPTFHEEQLHKVEYEKFEQSVKQTAEEGKEFNNDFVDSDFENNINAELENTVEDVQQITNTEPEPQYEEPTEEKPLQPYNPDGYLSDFSQVQDNDFFDELVIQTMADNNKNGLPEESSADEIFNFMSDDDVQEQTAEQPEIPVEPEPQVKEPEPVVNVTNPIVEEKVEEIKDETPEEVTKTVVQTAQEVEEEPDDKDLTMLTEAKIDDDAGLYLVNYDNFSSLVGHIKDDYFVIKKFDDVVNSRIILKQTEKLKDATRYLVRVGRNKMVVEVSETSMTRLLDL
ncbi:MAG: hypothetical protein K6E29_01390 [Cyanobacteria bacterium RUI128]|nr:hypothetical protein [Cyanobacteria bacterium RUI128]